MTPSRCPVGYTCTNTEVASTSYVRCECKSCTPIIYHAFDVKRMVLYFVFILTYWNINLECNTNTNTWAAYRFSESTLNTSNICLISAPCDTNPCSSGYYCSYTATPVNGKYYQCSGIFFKYICKRRPNSFKICQYSLIVIIAKHGGSINKWALLDQKLLCFQWTW